MKSLARWCLLAAVSFALDFCTAQVQTGTPPFQSFGGGPDVVNLGDLNVHYSIPIFSRAGRGIPFSYALSYDSSFWRNTGTTWYPDINWGLGKDTAALVGTATVNVSQASCRDLYDGTRVYYTRYVFTAYTDAQGTMHPFLPPLSVHTDEADGTCTTPTPTATGVSTDGSGITMTVTNTPSATVKLSNGETIIPVLVGSGSSTGAQTDNNGNRITSSTVSGTTTLTDTLGTVALTISGAFPSPVNYTYPGPAGNRTATVSYKSYIVQTAFGCSVTDYGPMSNSLVDKITLPDTTYYQFTYEITPGHSPNVTGRIASIRLPTGATISYNYTGYPIMCSDGSASGFKRTTPDGTWTYARTGTAPAYTTTITDPQGNVTKIQFQGNFETQRDIYQGSATGTPLETIYTCYNGNGIASPSTCSTTAVATPFSRITKFRKFNGGPFAEMDTLYNGYGLPTEVDEYDFGTSTPTRKITTTYASLGNNIVDRPASIVVKDGSNNLKAQTTFAYDETAVIATSGVPNHVAVTGSRGNLTTVRTYSTTTANLVRTSTFYDTGQVSVAKDVNTAQTTYTYGACAHAFVTSVALPLSLSRSYGWNCNGGVMTSSTDENAKVTTFGYGDSNFWRQTSVSYPDGGQTTTTYNTVTAPWNIQTSSKIDASRNLTGKTVFNSLGRVQQTQLTSDPAGTVYTDTTYDSLGRVASVSNPYHSTSDQTYGITQYTYDALNRATKVTRPNSNTVLTDYNNRATRVQDEGNGSARITKIYQVDGLGRTVSACEVTSATQLGITPTPAACNQDIAGTGFLTTYQYDTLGNTTGVTQGGLNPRTYAYDMLSRLTSETNPEAGAITYTYDTTSAGDLYQRTAPKPNQTSPSVKVVTTYSYDALHRLTDRSYNDGSTPHAAFSYDQTSISGVSPTNPKGRLTYAAVSGANTIFSYDSMGRLADDWQCTPLNCGTGSFHMQFGYDLAGDLTSQANYAQNVTYNYTYDTAVRLANMTSNYIDANHPGTLFTVNQYNALGQVKQATLGNGVVRTLQYDNLGRPTSLTDGSLYSFSLSYAPDSNIITGNDSVNGSWSYTYDQFARLSSSGKTGLGFQYTYDRFGNRWQQNLTSGSGPNPSYTFDANNHISGSGVLYDAAGNIINDGLGHTFTYDAENRLIAVSGSSSASYLYDALGQRVQETVNGAVRNFVFDAAGRLVTQMSPGWARGELYAGGLHVGTYANSTTYFDHSDWLGTMRARSNVSGASVETCTSLPFGDAQTCTGTEPSPLHFTGQEWDSETNFQHLLFRQLSTTQGRWVTPDPAGLAAVDFSNPQSWNRYAYVGNQPLNSVDPLGLCREDQDKGPCRDPNLRDAHASDGNCTINGMPAACGLVGAMAGAGGGGEFGIVCATCSAFGYGTQWTVTSGGEVMRNIPSAPGYDPDDGDGPYGAITKNSIWVDLGPASFLAANSGGIWDDVKNWFHTAQFLGVGGSFWIAHPAVPVGWSPGANFVSDGKQIHGCASILAGGVGAKVPGGSVGLLFGDKSKAAAIIRGWSVTLNINTPFYGLGGQVIASSAGTLAGPSVGTPGVSLQVGYGGPCAP